MDKTLKRSSVLPLFMTKQPLVFVALFIIIPFMLSGCTKNITSQNPSHSMAIKPKIERKPAKCKAASMTEFLGAISCEKCHKGKIDEVASSVHFTHKSPVANIDGINGSWGMANLFSGLAGAYSVNNWLGILDEKSGEDSGCGRCHISGIYPKDDPTSEEKAQVDCLICHAPAYDMSLRKVRRDQFGEYFLSKDDRLSTAQSVKGQPPSQACERCHLKSAGGANYKRGTPYNSLVDVHAAKKMLCVDCHKAKKHKIVVGHVSDIYASELPEERLDCIDCHKDKNLACAEQHQRIACVACHVPVSRGLVKRDFSKLSKNENGFYIYDENVEQAIPTYFWTTGKGTTGERPIGSRKDQHAKIAPFKKTVVINIADAQSGKVLPLKLLVLKQTGDIDQAVKSSQADLGFTYSGKWRPKTTVIYRQLSHSITKDKALKCVDCHFKKGVIDWPSLGYSRDEIDALTKPNKKLNNQ